jgi:hypothetical protein
VSGLGELKLAARRRPDVPHDYTTVGRTRVYVTCISHIVQIALYVLSLLVVRSDRMLVVPVDLRCETEGCIGLTVQHSAPARCHGRPATDPPVWVSPAGRTSWIDGCEASILSCACSPR